MNLTLSDADRRIRRIGRSMFAVTVAMAFATAVVAVVAAAFAWLAPEVLDDVIRQQILPPGVSYELTPPVVAIVLLLGFAPVVAVEWGLWNAALLFRSYGVGSVLTEATGRRLRHFGVALIELPVLVFLARPIGTLVLTINNVPGQRQVLLSADASWVIVVVAGAILIGIGWGIVEAARIADENRSFV
jgi:hypothetical protein